MLNKIAKLMVMGSILVACVIAGLWFFPINNQKTDDYKLPDQDLQMQVDQRSVIDYSRLDKDNELKSLMLKRKNEHGIETGVDVIMNSDESLKIGNSTVSMQEIIDKMRLKSGEIVEKNIASSGHRQEKQLETLGIYVVQKGDNIWNIHFKFLQDYFNHKGISLLPTSDEPNQMGYSSGIGKLLKFSEKIVSIYNIREKKLDVDIDLINPLSKLVVYHMTHIFELLDAVDYNHVNQIQFDGETLWISSK